MARSVTFNGMTMFRPGGLTKVDASALAQITLATNGIIGLIGEADGGEPGAVTTIDDPALAKGAFRSGPLADAIRVAFDPSNDPRVPGGAFRCLCVKTNRGTQAQLPMYNKIGADTAAAGSTTTLINLTTGGLVASEMIGNILRIGTEERPITANAVGTITVSPAFSSAPVVGTALTILASVVTIKSRDYGLHTNQIQMEYEPGASLGQAWTTMFDKVAQIGEDIGGKSYLQLEYIGQSARVIQAAGNATGGSTTTIVDSAALFTTGLIGYFVSVTLGGVINLRKITGVTPSTTLQVVTMTGSPIAEAYQVKTGQIRGVGDLPLPIATAGGASSITLEAALNVAPNELVGMIVVITGGTGSGQRRSIASHTAGVSAVLTTDQPWVTRPDATSTYELRHATIAKATISGAAGKATSLKTYTAVNGAVLATLDKTFTFVTDQTLEDLVTAINANADYKAMVPDGVNSKTFLVRDFDFDLGAVDVDIRNDKDTVTTPPSPTANVPVPWSNNFRADLWAMIQDINEKNQTITATRASGTGKGAGQGRPEFTGGSLAFPGDTFKYLTGGIRGVSANSDWQDAFDLLLKQRCNFVVALISQDLTNEGYTSTATWSSVAAQLSAHVKAANGIEKTERGGLIGYKGTKTSLIAKANSLNNTDIQITSQQPTCLDVDGNLKVMGEWAEAVLAAGMRGGMPEVGEPLTHKFPKVTEITQDSSWDPSERTDANQLIQAGVLFAENIKGKGIRWVRDLTTHVQDDNLAYMEGSARDVVRFVSYGLRTTLEDRFTGVKASPANAESIRDTATEYLELVRSQNIIVDSTSSTGAIIKAFHNLRVKISGDIATIRVEIFPVVGINFQLNEIYLQLPTQSA